MTNAICAFTYDFPEALRAAFGSGCKHLVELSPENKELQYNSPEKTAAISVSLLSRSAYRYLIASEICRELNHLSSSLDAETTKAIRTTLHEAISNAIVHGNLDIHSNFKTTDEMEHFYRLVKDRLREPEYGNKRVLIEADYPEKNLLAIAVTDEGAGFDYESKFQQLSGKSFDKNDSRPHGMGLALFQSMSHKVEYSNGGRTLTLHFVVPDTPVSTPKREIVTDRYESSEPLILIVDDMEYNRYIVRSILNTNGYDNIVDASNGIEAIAQIQRNKPDLIISDLTMPQMDGFEFCKAVRKIPGMQSTPIIVQTSMMNVDERIKSFEYGANDLIEQPVHSKELMARIELHIQRAKSYQKLEEYRSRLEIEIEMARQMHLALLPGKNEVNEIETKYGIHIANFFEASYGIGGDIWGVIPISDNEIGIYSCDFTGHGVGAAINTFRLNAALPSYLEYASQPGVFLSELNQLLYNILPTEQFATFFYGVVDVEKREFRYSAAGAPNPVYYSAEDGETCFIDSSGVPLGVVRSHDYAQASQPIYPGDTIFLYSDALTETPVDEDQRFIHEHELTEILKDTLKDPSDKRYQTVIRNFVKTLGLLEGASCDDDLTMVLISLKDSGNQTVSAA